MVENSLNLHSRRGSRVSEYDSLLMNEKLMLYHGYVMSHHMSQRWMVLSGVQLKQEFMGFVKKLGATFDGLMDMFHRIGTTGQPRKKA